MKQPVTLEGGLALLLAGAATLLGGSASSILAEMSLAILAAVVMFAVVINGTRPVDARAATFCAALAIVPIVIQLVPLPASLWQLLPARGQDLAVAELVGASAQWRPITLSPDASLYALTALAPPLVMGWLTLQLTTQQQSRVALLIIALAVAASLLGIAQATGLLPWNPYEYYHAGVATGLFASRNHFADFLLLSIGLTLQYHQSAKPGRNDTAKRIAIGAIMVLFAAAMIASASRSGIVLGAILIVIASRRLATRLTWARTAIIVTVIATGYLVATDMVSIGGAAKVASDRFALDDEARFGIWRTALAWAQTFLPFGSGSGTFTIVHPAFETVGEFTDKTINAAHNEYIQLLCEFGVLAILALVALVVGVFHRVRQIGGRPDADLVAVALVFVHAAGDYPARVFAISSIVMFVLACRLAPTGRGSRTGHRQITYIHTRTDSIN